MNDPTPLKRFLRNPVFANVLMMIIIVGGVLGTMLMVREIFPDFALNKITVTVPYPGADPAEVEEGICRPLETALEGLEGTRRVQTLARAGVGSAIIDCEDYVDVDVVKQDVRDRLDTIRTFPKDAEEPVVKELSLDRQVLSVAIWGDLPERQLKELGLSLKDDLLQIPGVSRASLAGTRDYEIAISVSETRLRQFGLSFDEISRAVAAGSLNLPAGTLRTDAEDLTLRIIGRRYHARDFSSLVVRALPDGRLIRLGDIAELEDGFTEDVEAYSRFNGKRAVTLSVQKTDEEDSIRISHRVRAFLEKRSRELPPTVNVTVWGDVSRLIEGRIGLLVRNGLVGLCLVFISLWLFLDLRLSFWVTMGIPISLAGGLGLMAATGQTINMISLFALIMVLGIIVDDAIIVGEAIYVHRDLEGPMAAALHGTGEVVWPVFTAVITTVVAFMPLFFVSGVMGKFIRVMPGPIVAALLVSLMEALLILPVHLRHLPPRAARDATCGLMALPRRLRQIFGRGLEAFVNRVYGALMYRLLPWRYATIAVAVTVFLLAIGLVQGGLIRFIFFPAADSDFIHCAVELPGGTPVAATGRMTDAILAAWERTEEAVRPRLPAGSPLAVGVFALTGGTLDPDPRSGTHLTDVFVELIPAEERQIHYQDVVSIWREQLGPVAGAVSVTLDALDGGPGGADIGVDLRGRSFDDLASAVAEMRQWLGNFAGVYDIQSSYKTGKRELRAALRPAARPLGLTLADLARQLRQGFYGDEVMRIQRGREEVKIMLRYPGRERRSLGDLQRLRIRTPQGYEVPLEQVAKLTLSPGPATIVREEGMRVVSVSAETGPTADAGAIMDAFWQQLLPELRARYQVEASAGQELQDRMRSLKSLAVGGAIAMLVIYLILATVFKSYLQPLIIMTIIPLGLIGAIIGHLLFRLPITMMSLFGMVALTGIVVNDAIVMIVAINTRLAEGMPFNAAIVEGGQRRFRAILLTSLTTFAGLFPIILERSFQAQFLIPMAIAIAFGVMVATICTLVVLPCLLSALNDIRRLACLGLRLRWPEREEVEPARHQLDVP